MTMKTESVGIWPDGFRFEAKDDQDATTAFLREITSTNLSRFIGKEVQQIFLVDYDQNPFLIPIVV
jgi:hypothetical protein